MTTPLSPQVEKTVWDWELMNDIKPIWQRPAKEVEEDEYKAFYKTFSRVRLGETLMFPPRRSGLRTGRSALIYSRSRGA